MRIDSGVHPAPRRAGRHQSGRGEAGAAIVTALLVVTLASVIVSALFYRESVAVRSIENRLALSQTRWVERAALDWAKVILRTDPSQTDHGTDVWATPVVDTQLDETVTGGAKIGDRSRNAFLAGNVTDAQARFNVNTLVQADGQPSLPHMKAMTKLMSLLGLPESLVQQVYARILKSRPTTLDSQNIPAAEIRLIQFGDLRDIPGFDDAVMQTLQPFVTVLPVETTVNLNTAPAEVIAAMIPEATLTMAKSFIAQRERLPVTTLPLAKQWMGLDPSVELSSALLSVNTRFFLVYGMIRYDRVESQTETLIRRDSSGPRGVIQVVWQHRN
ncbi:MAG: type II secretion system minor pseudopilin GspK [Lautropia sp.]